MNILFIVPYPVGLAPSQRFRFEQYLDLLKSRGHRYEIHSFLTAANWRLFTKPGRPFEKLAALAAGFYRRFKLLFRVSGFDYVFIHREALPLGPPIVEWLIGVGLKKKITYDFDDAIWLTDRVNESVLSKWLRWRSKVSYICRISHRISCGNAYLASYARQFNQDVVINPTTIDTTHHRRREASGQLFVTIGWTGSKSTLKYLELLRDVIQRIQAKHSSVRFCVIADERPPFDWPVVSFIPWSKDREINDLEQFDIGIMPIPDDEWTRGKCGFKALQYMSLGIPAVVSPVGVNQEIIAHGVNGMIASSEKEWFDCLDRLIQDSALRTSLGLAGEERVRHNYSVESNAGRFLALFK